MLEDAKAGVVAVQGLAARRTTSADETLALLAEGNRRRTVEPTAANALSSRSHAVLQARRCFLFSLFFDAPPRPVGGLVSRIGCPTAVRQVTVRCVGSAVGAAAAGAGAGGAPNRAGERRPAARGGGGPTVTTREAKLTLVDLAGSERASATQNTGARLNEGARINRSLLALANCINALSSSAAPAPPTPSAAAWGGAMASAAAAARPTGAVAKFRDSKLTLLLKVWSGLVWLS